MEKKSSPNLVYIFTTARDENLHAARENFEYVYQNGGYNLEDLAVIFRQSMPVIQWEKSAVRRFLHPELTEGTAHKVTLLSATPQHITSFLKASIKLRDDIQNELARAKMMIIEARAQWGELADHPPQRQHIINSIRENFRYVHQNAGGTFEQLAVIFKEACPEYAWDKGAVRRFIYPEKSKDNHRDIEMISTSPDTLSDLLKASIDERTRVTNGLLAVTKIRQP